MMSTRLLAVAALAAIVIAAPARATTPCPSTVVFEPDATGSRVDAGWTGISHRMPVNGYAFRMDVSCGASSPPCGTCSITDLAPNAGGNNQRCTNDTSIVCTPMNEVAKCGGPGLCHFFAGAPTAISSGGVSSCYTTEVTGMAGGSVDVDTGAVSPDIPLKVALYNGITNDNPCPRCLNDPTANDNALGGTCSGGARSGLLCDANATAEYPDFGSTSFDCPPSPGGKIADFILGTVSFSTGSQSRTLSATNPDCTGFGPGSGLKCFCDTCNNGSNQTCQSNSDCPDPPGPIGPICGGKRCLAGTNAGAACTANSECPSGLCGLPGEFTKPNGCLDDTTMPGFQLDCTDTAPVDGEGECDLGPTDSSCSIASGHPQRGCLNDSDCGNLTGSCQSSQRPCFLDKGLVGGTVSVSGTSTPPVGNTSDPTTLAALTCLAPTSSSAVNDVGGFPGLARGSYPGRAIFAEKVVDEVAQPGGTVTTTGTGGPSVVETSVTTPNGGEVEIIGTFNTGTPPTGYLFLGRLVDITAPPASAASPLQITFDIDASEIPAGESFSTIEIFRDGVGPIPNCLGATQAIPNDPCISARVGLGGGDAQITVLSSHASEWTMATDNACPMTVDPGCRGQLDASKAKFTFKNTSPDSKDQLQYQWLSGLATTVAEFGDPVGGDDYAFCVYSPTDRTEILRAPAGGTCAGKPCWKALKTGFLYKDKDLTPSGIAQLSLKAGADGKVQIKLKGKGENLRFPVPSAPMTAQIRNVTTGQCWTKTFPNHFFDGVKFKAVP